MSNAQSRIKLSYEIYLEDGCVADATEPDQPFELTLGDGQLPDQFEIELLGLKPGDKKQFTLSAEQAYGERSTDVIYTMEISDFPAEIRPEVGAIVEFETPNGDFLPGLVLSVQGQSVEVDFNHPLAGKRLSVSVKLIDIS